MRLKVLQRRAWRTKSVGEILDRASSAGLAKVLTLPHLTCLGLGSIVGAGVFVLSGFAASAVAGPGVILSYVVAAAAAVLAGLCYSEFAVELPVAGGAFSFVSITFGEAAAWSVAWNMVLEVTLSSAAVSRGFSSYLATLVGLKPTDVLIEAGPLQLDPTALLLIALLTAVLTKGTKASMELNMTVSMVTISSILFVLTVGFPLADTANLQPFLPYGVRGVFSASSIVFFAFIGFDYIANASEEAANPTRDLPLSILLSISIAAALYVAMSAAITLMVPYGEIDVNAPFSAAFRQRGMGWAARVVSLGAVAGILTSTMTGLFSQARLFVVLGRESLLPEWLAAVHQPTETPRNATLLAGACAGALALALNINVLAELVSVGTLYVFWAVSCGVVFRRCHRQGDPNGRAVLGIIGALTAASLCLSLAYTYAAPAAVVLSFGALWLALAASVALLPAVWTPSRFAVPLFPATPALSILFTVHLMCSLGWPAYVRFAVWVAVGAAVYGLYGAQAAEAKEQQRERQFRSQLDGSEEGEEGVEVELVQRSTLSALGPERPAPAAGAAGGDAAALLPGRPRSAALR